MILPELPRFTGGAVGFLGYDVVQQFEHLPADTPDITNLPDVRFMIFDTIVIVDHVKMQIIVLANAHNTGDPDAAYYDAVKRIDDIVERLRQPLPHIPTADEILNAPLGIKYVTQRRV